MAAGTRWLSSRWLSEHNYALYSGCALSIWLAHFQFGSGSGGYWLLIFWVLSLIYLYRHRQRRVPMLAWEWGLLAVAGSYFLVVLLGTFQLDGGLFGRAGTRALDNPSRLLLALPLYFAWRKSPMPSRWLLLACGLGIATVSLMQLQQFAQGARGTISVTGLHISQGEIIAALGAMLLLASWLLYRRGQYWLAAAAVAFWLLSLVSILLSGTRGAWVAMALSLLGFWLLVALDSWRAAALALLMSLALTTSAFYALDQKQRQSVAARFSNVTTTLDRYLSEDKVIPNSPGQRILMWEASLISALEQPFGSGSDSFKRVINAMADASPSARYEPVRRFGHAHNEFLNALVENGWQGLLALSALLLYPMWLFGRAYRRARAPEFFETRVYAACGLMLLISYVGSALTQALFSHHSVLLMFVVLLYCCCAQLRAWQYAAEQSTKST